AARLRLEAGLPVSLQGPVQGRSRDVDPAPSVQRPPQDLVVLRIRRVVQMLQSRYLTGGKPALSEQCGESVAYLPVTSLKDPYRGVRQVDLPSHQATSAALAFSSSREKSRPPPYRQSFSEPDRSSVTLSRAAMISAALRRRANVCSASLMVATLVSVPRISRAASSHSSFTSTVMRVMPQGYTKIGMRCAHHHL